MTKNTLYDPQQDIEIHVTGRNGTRRLMKQDYQRLYGKGGYRAVGVIWGLSAGMTWNMINKPNYWPKDKKIQEIIEAKAEERGIRITKPGRKPDLLSMSDDW